MGIEAAAMPVAARMAARWRTGIERVLLGMGWIGEERFYRRMAAHCGASFIEGPLAIHPGVPLAHALAAAMAGRPLPLDPRSGLTHAVAPRSEELPRLAAAYRRDPDLAGRVAFTTPQAIADAMTADADAPLMREAAGGLAARTPHYSAKRTFASWQAALCGFLAALAAMAPVVDLSLATAVAGWTASALFLACWTLRLAAALEPPARRRLPEAGNSALPDYSVIVPVYGEAALVPRLMEALAAIDYPPPKLDILVVAEADDAATLRAIEAVGLPAGARLIRLAPGEPRTKPKALNAALHLARGELLTIYDAEDRPAPDQLRRAAAAFAGDPQAACLQARLAFENAGENWLTRSFAIEYATLFDAVLPGLERYGLPLPLGGTSNHFRTAMLLAAGGWDPHNVTEDADLGIRLARLGHRVGTLDSTTLEEAPRRLANWLAQRTRWTKGWMQTLLVHSREPRRTWRELGPLKALAMLAFVGGIVGSALLHPWCLAWVIAELALGRREAAGDVLIAYLATANLAFGYVAGWTAGWIGMRRRGIRRFLPTLLTLPAYWFLCSLGAYRAVFDLLLRPFHWDRTRHGESRRMHLPEAGAISRMLEEKRYSSLRSSAADSSAGRL
ncbi:MAG: glycosyltransferase [Flavobacteriaceae bacterium]